MGSVEPKTHKRWKSIITKHENVNGCSLSGMMSVLLAKLLGVIKWRVHGGSGNRRLGGGGDLRELCLFLHLIIHHLCQLDSLHLVLKFKETIFEIVNLKEINYSPPAGFFRVRQSAVTSPQLCQNILQFTVFCQLFEALHTSPAWKLKHILGISLFQIWESFSFLTQECSYFMQLVGEPPNVTASDQHSCQ